MQISSTKVRTQPRIDPDRNFLVLMLLYTKDLLGYPLYRILLTLYVLGNCSLVTMGSIVNILATSFEFESFIGSIIALIVIILGLTSSILYSIYFIRRTRQSKILALFCMTCILALVSALVSAINQ